MDRLGSLPAAAEPHPLVSDADILRLIMVTMEQAALVHDSYTVLAANARLNSLLEIPEELIRPGTPIERFVEFGVERGDYARGAGISLERMREKMKAGQNYRTECRLPSGRILRVDNRFRDKLAIGHLHRCDGGSSTRLVSRNDASHDGAGIVGA